MKLRIKGNSVRLRLSKTDIDTFGKDGYLEEKTEFPNHTFTYAVQKLFDGKTLDASFTEQKLTVYIPHDIQENWINSELVGFDHQLQIADDKTLFLLIEKDFKCTDEEVNEDQSDFFDHPVKNC